MRWESAIVLQLQSPFACLSIFARVCDFIVLQLIKTNPRFSVLLSVRFCGVRFWMTWLLEYFQFLLPMCPYVLICLYVDFRYFSWAFSHDVLHKCRSCIIVASFGRPGTGYEREDLPITPMIILMIDQFKVLRRIIIPIDRLTYLRWWGYLGNNLPANQHR